MITQFKIFENNNPKIGDYAIFTSEDSYYGVYGIIVDKAFTGMEIFLIEIISNINDNFSKKLKKILKSADIKANIQLDENKNYIWTVPEYISVYDSLEELKRVETQNKYNL